MQYICGIILCQCLDRDCVFRRRHSGKGLELPGKVMDGGITEGIRDLRKVCLFLPDHLFCFLDFQIRKVVDHPAVLFFLKELLQLGFSHKIRLADLIEGQLAVQMIFHIQKDPLVEDGIVFFPGGFFGRIWLFFLFEAAKHRQEKQFQIKLDHLFRGKGGTGAPFHFLGKGVIERRCDAVAGLADDLSEKRFFRLTDGGDEVAELFHTGGIAGKGNHDKIGSNLSRLLLHYEIRSVHER